MANIPVSETPQYQPLIDKMVPGIKYYRYELRNMLRNLRPEQISKAIRNAMLTRMVERDGELYVRTSKVRVRCGHNKMSLHRRVYILILKGVTRVEDMLSQIPDVTPEQMHAACVKCMVAGAVEKTESGEWVIIPDGVKLNVRKRTGRGRSRVKKPVSNLMSAWYG